MSNSSILNRQADTRQGFLARLLRDRSGNALGVMAAATIPLLGAVGAAVDLSRTYLVQEKLQNACDAAVLGTRYKMIGNVFTEDAKAEGRKLFDFNFPEGTMGTTGRVFSQSQAQITDTEVKGNASAHVPTTVSRLVGKDKIEVAVDCNADISIGRNDVMMVLDITGSMLCQPGNYNADCGGVEQPGSRMSVLRSAMPEIYRTLGNPTAGSTRFGFMPYSSTVNVVGDLANNDLLDGTAYWKKPMLSPTLNRQVRNLLEIDILTRLGLTSLIGNLLMPARDKLNMTKDAWRAQHNGGGCIEERPSNGNNWNNGSFRIENSVSQADIDARATGPTDTARQWGLYDEDEDEAADGISSSAPHYRWRNACPARAKKLSQYTDEASFNAATAQALSVIKGSTYHDIGMTWGLRYLSPTGLFAADNPQTVNGLPVNKHIIFLTDGDMYPNSEVYSAYGIEGRDNRQNGAAWNLASAQSNHHAAFISACDRAKSMGVTIWVVAFDVNNAAQVNQCATSTGHAFTVTSTNSQASMISAFRSIGSNIARLRLTK